MCFSDDDALREKTYMFALSAVDGHQQIDVKMFVSSTACAASYLKLTNLTHHCNERCYCCPLH